jgi:uncharacterized YigZ family protein
MTVYRTIAADGEAEIEVKRSRFLCTLERVDGETAARAVVDRLRRQHWDARHHCSAFVLGPLGEIARSNDDGEPAGTAGAPMLEVLRGAGLSDVSVVVSRYFGGVLLGAGGLVRAYGDAVRAGLEVAGVQDRQLLTLWDVTVDHADAARLENDLRARGVAVRSVDYADQATLHLATDGDLAAVVRELTAGTVAPTRSGEVWVDVLH